MDTIKAKYIKLKEGSATNYFEALLRTFGGEVKNNAYTYKEGRTDINLSLYKISDLFELVINNSTHYETLVAERKPDNDPDFVHFHIVKEGGVNQSYDNKSMRVEAGSPKGVFMYNGLFPIVAEYQPDVVHRAVTFRVKRQYFEDLMPEALPIFNQLFGDKAVAYHFPTVPELERLTEDIFKIDRTTFGNRQIICARGIESFVTLIRYVKQLYDKEELNGLHVDDYNRLQKIKDKLLMSFEEGINIELLAQEFGISVSKLNRDFKTLFNYSIYKFFTHAKMDEAFRQLKTGNFSVMEVGYSLGYQNISTFSEMFKKIKGIYPKDVISLSDIQ